MKHFLLRAMLFASILAALSFQALGQVQFVPLPLGFSLQPFGPNMSADGTVVVGIQDYGGALRGVSLWSPGQPLLPITQAMNRFVDVSPNIQGVSDDGTKVLIQFWAPSAASTQTWMDVAGNTYGLGSYLWQQGVGFTALPKYTNPSTGLLEDVQGLAISGDGNVIIGRAVVHPISIPLQWTGLVGPTVPCWGSTVNNVGAGCDISYDGSAVLIGGSNHQLWYINGCTTWVIDEATLGIPGYSIPGSKALSSDGTLVGIESSNSTGGRITNIWSPLSGVLYTGYIGVAGFDSTNNLYGGVDLWSPTTGAQTLKSFYEGLGAMPLGSVYPTWPSAGGNAVLGNANSYFGSQPWGYEGYSCVAYINQPTPGSIGANFCGQTPLNSSGYPSLLNAKGSAVLADNNLTMEATFLPPNQFGYVLNSRGRDFVLHAAGSRGNLCLGGGQSLGRHNSLASIRYSGAQGTFSVQLDTTSLPTNLGQVAANVGETWNFQVWHRDTVNGTSTSNFTDAVSITFQ